MKYYEQTFKIKHEPTLEFKVKRISPVKLLSVITHFANKNIQSTEEVFGFALENIEVLILDKWFPVKEQDKEIYWPTPIEDNISALQELVSYFVGNVLSTVFTKSSK